MQSPFCSFLFCVKELSLVYLICYWRCHLTSGPWNCCRRNSSSCSHHWSKNPTGIVRGGRCREPGLKCERLQEFLELRMFCVHVALLSLNMRNQALDCVGVVAIDVAEQALANLIFEVGVEVQILSGSVINSWKMVRITIHVKQANHFFEDAQVTPNIMVHTKIINLFWVSFSQCECVICFVASAGFF